MQRSAYLWIVVSLACSKKEPPAAGSGSAQPVAADAPVKDAAAALDASAPAASAKCIPEDPPYFGRIGAELVGCMDDTQCWTIDPKTGAVTPRAAAHIPGVGYAVETAKLKKPGCYEELCWTVPKREHDADESRIWVAYHPDGKRVAIMDDPVGTIFDRATKKPLATFTADLSNSLGGLWFAGNFVMDAGYDAGPYAVLVYHDANTGKKVGTFEDFYGGAAGITSTGAVVVTGEDMTTVTVVEGASYKGKTTKRKIPKAPAGCSPQDPGLDTESDDPKVKACAAFATKHYTPYSEVTLVDDPAGAAAFVGLHHGELLAIDKNLAEISRVKIALCPKKPGED